MKKVTNVQVREITKIMQQTINSYFKVFVADEQQHDVMYTNDILHNTNALLNFIQTKDTYALHNAIMLQDTLVREYFITTLRYIENNELIPAYYNCCI